MTNLLLVRGENSGDTVQDGFSKWEANRAELFYRLNVPPYTNLEEDDCAWTRFLFPLICEKAFLVPSVEEKLLDSV